MKANFKNRVFLFFGDIFFLYISLLITLLLRYKGFPVYPLSPSTESFFIYYSPLFLIWIFFLWMFDFYSLKLRTGSFDFLRIFLIFVFFCLSSGALYFYLQPDLPVSPKMIFLLEILVFSILFFIWRLFFDFIFKNKAKKEKVVILGSPEELDDLIFHLNMPRSSYRVLKVIKEDEDTSKIKEIIEKNKVKKIIVSKGLDPLRGISFFSKLEIESFANFYEEATGKISLQALEDARYTEEFYKKEEKTYLILKRIFDIVLSFVGALVFFILFPFMVFLIKVDSNGPLFFIQERVGKNRKLFNSYKFRSMIKSEKEEKELWREKNKKEITRAGKFLRFTHFDELPQLLNIARGDMSFIGPRQEWKKLSEKFEEKIPFYFLRYKVKPGLTGWAQINFPASSSVEEAREKFKYDLYYIKHRSLLFDTIIFFKSLKKAFLG